MKEIVIATHNRGKVREMAAALQGLPLRILALTELGAWPEPVENGRTMAENARIKAAYYATCTGRACLADDSGLEVDALGGRPGVHSARFAGVHGDDAANNAKLLALLADVPDAARTARFRCCLVLQEPDGGAITAQGVCEGLILRAPRGTNGFGYDPLFYIPGLGRTMAELTTAEKNAISHRGRALANLRALLEGREPCVSA